ncbi:MAG: 3D domain-containing protein [Phycisphaeraceae bacterium]|nr:3D domain-containing protein [Phycisphaeraceae bacterium]
MVLMVVMVLATAGVLRASQAWRGQAGGPVELMRVDDAQGLDVQIVERIPISDESAQEIIAQEATDEAASVPVAAEPVQRVSQAPVKRAPATPMYDGRPIRPAYKLRMLVTAYSPDERSCGKWADGITASGMSVWTNGMKLVAADTRVLPMGTILTVPGYNNGKPVPVLDRGGKIKGKRLDVLYPTHEIARTWGKQWLEVVVWEYADGKPAGSWRSKK